MGAFNCVAQASLRFRTRPRRFQERLILSAISPIKIVDLTFSFTRDRSGSKLKPLFFPPAMRMTGLILRCAALCPPRRGLSPWSRSHNRRRLTSRTNSQRCGRGSYAHSGGTISCERQSACHAGGERRHQVLDVVQAAQFDIRQPQDRFRRDKRSHLATRGSPPRFE